MRIFRGLLAVLIAAGIIAGAAFFASSDSSIGRGTVTLWCVDGSGLTDKLKEAVGDYNSSPNRTGLLVEVHSFESEEKLAEAFEISSPDILLCAHTRAFSLSSREKLTDISAELLSAPRYSPAVTGRKPCIGRSFFPIGFDLPVLIINNALCEKTSFDSLEAMLTEASAYTAETDDPFFGCDGYSKLFSLMMLRNGKTFSADFENESGKLYIDLYNLFARAAFDGSMYTETENTAQYVSAGALPCAIVSSSSLAGMELDGMSVSDVPAPADAVNADTVGTALGFAVTNGGSRSTSDIAAFISWFFEEGRCAQCAKSSALASAETVSDALTGTLSKTLSAIAEKSIVSLTEYDPEYVSERESFDERFASAMRNLR